MQSFSISALVMTSTHHQEEHWNRMGAKPKRRSTAVKPAQGDRRRGKREESLRFSVQNLHRLRLASVSLFFDLTLCDVLEKIAIHFR